METIAQEAARAAEGAVEAVEDAVAELFPPRPGGLVDRHRQRRAAELAREADAEHAAEPVEEPGYRAVKVAIESPEIISAITYTLAPGQSAMILPNSPYRSHAYVNLLFASSTTVVLAKDQGQAIGGAGYTLCNGNPPLLVTSRAQLWAYNNAAATVFVSVMAELYAPEQHAAPAPAKRHRHGG